MEKSSKTNGGIGILGVISAVLIALKVSGMGIKLLILLLAILYVKWLDRRW